MGLDLTLMPFTDHGTSDAYAHTMLDCNRSSVLFEAIMDAVKPHEQRVPRYFPTFRGRTATPATATRRRRPMGSR